MPTVEWIGSTREDSDAGQLSPARLVNLYREPIGDGKFSLKSVLGMNRMTGLAPSISQAMDVVGNSVYAVSGGDVYRISGRSAENLFSASPRGQASISGNNGSVIVVAGGDYYHWDGATRTRPTTATIDQPGSVDFIGQRTILTELNGRLIQWSAVADGTSFDGLDFATAEARDDNILRGAVINNIYWVFGETSIEQWALTGGTNFIAPLPGRVVDIGLESFELFTKVPNGAFFVGNDGIAYFTDGSSMSPVSSRAVETSIEQNNPTHCFYYQDEGHKFCVIRFEDRPAWVYDLSAGEWHERAQGTDLGPWQVRHGMYHDGSSYVIAGAGDVCILRRTNTDFGSTLLRLGISGSLGNDGNRFSVDALRFIPVTGRGRLGGTGISGSGQTGAAGDGMSQAISVGKEVAVRDASISLRTSRDFGETWGNRRSRSIGGLGNYYTRVNFRMLGQFRQFTAEITMSDPVEAPLSTLAQVDIS